MLNRFYSIHWINVNWQFTWRYCPLLIMLVLPLILMFSCHKKELGKVEYRMLTLTSRAKGSISQFIHPGIVNDKNNLDFISAQLSSGNQNRHIAYQKLLDFINTTVFPISFYDTIFVVSNGTTPSESQIKKDALLSYAFALKWANTGDPEDANKAIYILNGWSNTFKCYLPSTNTYERQCWLEASWSLPNFLAAAEIVRHYIKPNGISSGWTETDIMKFRSFINRIKNDYINPMVQLAYADNVYKRNMGVSAGYAKMVAGIFLDSETVFKSGRDLLLSLLPVVINSSGVLRELCDRDCWHPQYSLNGFTYAAETLSIQGDSVLYKDRDERLKLGWLYYVKSYNNQLDCRSCANYPVYPAIEMASKIYSTGAINLVAAQNRPFGIPKDNTFLGFTSYTHVM